MWRYSTVGERHTIGPSVRPRRDTYTRLCSFVHADTVSSNYADDDDDFVDVVMVRIRMYR
jgi:hypothetical protein